MEAQWPELISDSQALFLSDKARLPILEVMVVFWFDSSPVPFSSLAIVVSEKEFSTGYNKLPLQRARE